MDDLDRFEAFFADVGGRMGRPMRLEDFQRRLIAETFGPQRELLALLPRGCGKTTLMAARGLFELVTRPDAEIFCAAASREQAQIAFDTARRMALSHPAIEKMVEITRRELRTRHGIFKVLPAEAGHVYGLAPTVVLIDELAWHKTDELYVALRSSVHKRHARVVTISTAGGGQDGPLYELRKRALALDAEQDGALTICRGEHMVMFEWAVDAETPVTDLEAFKAANPASWVRVSDLEELREGLPEHDFKMLHGNVWIGSRHPWLPGGAWAGCAGEPTFTDGEDVYVAVDLGGGQRSSTAVVWANRDLHIGAAISGDEYPVEWTLERVDELAKRYRIAELTADEWRAPGLLEEARQRGIPVTVFAQSDSRMCPASERLYSAIVEGRLVHGADPVLDAHVHAAVAKRSRRGWRLERPDRDTHVDGAVALAMCVDRAEQPQPEVKLLGWV